MSLETDATGQEDLKEIAREMEERMRPGRSKKEALEYYNRLKVEVQERFRKSEWGYLVQAAQMSF